MRDREIKNAKIESTMLGVEDHGIFTFYLGLSYGGGGQSAGGYRLDSPKPNDPRVGKSIELIKRTLEVIGVEKWEDLKGKYLRVDADWNKVYRIGHITDEKWLDFAKFYEEP